MALSEAALLPTTWWEQFEDPPGYRAEVIRGELVLSPSASRAHQLAVFRLARILDDACPDGFQVIPDIEWRLEVAGLVAQAPRPDIAVVRAGGGPIVEPPLLVVEVLSPSDEQWFPGHRIARVDAKVLDYAAAGLRHYLEVDLRGPSVVLYELSVGVNTHRVRTKTIVLAGQDQELRATEPFSFSFWPRHLV